MTTVTVTVNTASKDNLAQGGTECKFYRTYDFDQYWLIQYGSKRNGPTGGQFKLNNAGHTSRAASSAQDQFHKKLNEGYSNDGRQHFDVELSKFQEQLSRGGDKGAGQWLENMYDAARASGKTVQANAPQVTTTQRSTRAPKAAPSVPTTPNASVPNSAEGTLADITSRALAAISLAATEPAKALTEHAKLTHALEEVELGFRKARSYLSTLDSLIEEAL